LEAAGRAEALLRDEDGRMQSARAGAVTWDPTLADLPSVKDHPPVRPRAVTEDAPLGPKGIGDHSDPAAAPTPEARVDPRLGAVGPHLNVSAEDVFVPSDIPALFAPAFRGRDALLNEAVRSFTVGAAKPTVLWFRGPTGSGRTRLLAEIRDLLRFDVGGIVLAGRGVDPAIGLSAIRLLFDRVPSYLRKISDEDIERALGSSLVVVGDLCPGLKERLQNLISTEGPPPDPGSRRVLYYQAAERLVALVLRLGPLAILMDDVDRADPDSLDLIRHLATLPPDDRMDRGRPRLIVLASIETTAPWAGADIELPPLLGTDIAVTLQTALGWNVPPTRLARRAVVEGVNATPRDLLEWTCSLLEAVGGRSGRETDEETLLAAAAVGPRGRWRSRMAHLDPLSLEFLVVLSMLPRPVVLEWLLTCSDWEEGAFVSAVNLAVQRDLVVERPTARGWGFELAEREVGESAWTLLHPELRSALALRFGLAVLADHTDHPVDPDARPGLAARSYLKAGLSAQALPLLELATRQEQASGRAASGLAMADLWVETAEELDIGALFMALEARVQLAGAACEWDRSREDLDRMDRLTQGQPQQQLRSLTARATIAQQSQDHEGVIQSVERAFDVALEIDASAEQLFRLSHLLASVDLRSGSLVTARDRWMMIARDAQRAGTVVWEMLSRSTAAGAELQLGEFDASEAGCKLALALARQLPDYLMELHLRHVLASLDALRERSDAAIVGLQEVVDETSEIGALRILSQAAMTLGEVHRHCGNFDVAQQHLERAERLLRATGQRVSLSRCLAERALTALAMGDLPAAQGFAAGSGLAASLAPGVLLGQERIHCALGKIAEAQGDRHALSAARKATLDCLDRQAAELGPEHLGRWTSVGPRMEVVTWVGWSPR
jgi:tetratricopeptide (TPR) repeat protein